MTKVKILVLGPSGVCGKISSKSNSNQHDQSKLQCGKTRISNSLADASTGSLPTDLRSTQGVRILEFDVQNLKVQNETIDIEVELWDCGGDERYMTCWPAMRKNVDGIMFIYPSNDAAGVRKLELFYNYFVSQHAFSPRQCIAFAHHSENDDTNTSQSVKLSSVFQRISQASVNLETSSEKLRYDFSQFLSSVVGSINKTI